MRKRFFIAAAVIMLLILTGCQKQYTLDSGRYMLTSDWSGENDVPYILLDDGRFTIVNDIRVSYQPSGSFTVNDDNVVMQSSYGGGTYAWVFRLTGDNELTFASGRSLIPTSWTEWKNGMVFVLTED